MAKADHEVDYASLFAALPAPHMVLRANEPDFTIVGENEAHARLIDAEEPKYSIGKGLLEAYPDTSDEYKKTGTSILLESVRRVARTGRPDSMPDIRYDLADREGIFVERWWRATHYPIKDKNGTVVQILQLTNDITEELAARRGMERAQSQLDLALEVGLVSTFVWDIKNDVLRGDRNMAKTFNVTYEQAQAGLPLKRFTDAVFVDDLPHVLASINRTMADGGTYEEEYRTVGNDGSQRWVTARGAVERDDDGDPLYFIGIIIDITERKEAQAELEDVKRMFDALFNSTILSVALANTDGLVLDANDTFLRTFGYDEDDLRTGLTTTILTAPSSRGASDELYDAIDKFGEARPMEKEYLRKDGSTFQGLVGAAKLPQSPDRFIAFILDVTENRRLKELNAAKDEFIALASHQLRTPATAVKQYLGIILEGYAGDVDETQRGYLQTANESNDRELTIINDLLKTAQLDTKGYKLKPKAVDVVALLRDVFTEFEPVMTMKKQVLRFTHDGPVNAHIDREETKIVLSNLVENAHKYSHEGTAITVHAGVSDGRVTIRVSDEGVGISEKDQGVIFDKFTRVDNPLSDMSNGNGLGLYWVKRIVTLHGGSLTVTSTVGEGSTFVVELPQ